MRYIVEYISGAPTPGQTRLHQGKDYFLDRAHRAYPRMHKYVKVILLLRDYRECFLRQHNDNWARFDTVSAFCESRELRAPPFWYIRNLQAFDSFDGSKLLLYYEDLVLDPVRSVRQVAAFLGLDSGRTRDFAQNIEERYSESVTLYRAGGHTSETSCTKNMHAHADRLLRPQQLMQFDDYFFKKFPELAQKYLGRYDMRTRSLD